MESKTSSRKMKKMLRVQEAWELRKAGWSITDIAKKQGVDIACASRYVSQAHTEYQRVCKEEAVEAARLDLSRLDALIKSHWQTALLDPKTGKFVLDLLRSRERIYGYAAPTKQEVQITGNTDDLSPDALKKKLEEALKPVEADAKTARTSTEE